MSKIACIPRRLGFARNWIPGFFRVLRNSTAPRACGKFTRGLAGLFIFVASCPTHGATYHVGPKREYPNLQAIASELKPGDVVEVDGDATYPGGVTFSASGTAERKITIRGVRIHGNR